MKVFLYFSCLLLVVLSSLLEVKGEKLESQLRASVLQAVDQKQQSDCLALGTPCEPNSNCQNCCYGGLYAFLNPNYVCGLPSGSTCQPGSTCDYCTGDGYFDFSIGWPTLYFCN